MPDDIHRLTTVGELITALQAHPADKPVYVRQDSEMLFGLRVGPENPDYVHPRLVEAQDIELADDDTVLRNVHILTIRD